MNECTDLLTESRKQHDSAVATVNQNLLG